MFGINLKVLVAMVTELCTHSISAMTCNACHAPEICILHKRANFEKSKTIFLPSSGSSSGFTNFRAETDSHSSASDSSHSQDWSEVSSDQTRSTDADEKPGYMAGHYGQLRRQPDLSDDFRGSSSSLPTYLNTEKEK